MNKHGLCNDGFPYRGKSEGGSKSRYSPLNKKSIDKETAAITEMAGFFLTIEVELTGSDAFKQTITKADGTKDIEFNERVKK